MTWLNSTLQIITDCWFWVPTFQNDCLHSSSTSLHTKWLCCFIYRSGVRVAPCLLSKQNPLPTLHKKTKQKNRKFRLTRKSLKKKYLFHKYQKCVDFHWRFYNSPYFLQAAIQRQSLGRVRLHLSIHFNPQFVSSWPDSRRNGGIFSPENSKILLWWKGKLEILILRCNPRVSSYIFPYIYIYTCTVGPRSTSSLTYGWLVLHRLLVRVKTNLTREQVGEWIGTLSGVVTRGRRLCLHWMSMLAFFSLCQDWCFCVLHYDVLA